MAVGFAIHNSMTDHGGVIKATQMRSSQMGNLFLVADDGHYCPKCKCWSKIIKSHDHIIFDGKSVAYVGDKLTCGAKILPKQMHVVGDSGRNNMIMSQPIFKVFSEKFCVVDKETDEPLPFVNYKIYRENGEIEKGVTDANGLIDEIINKERSENIRVEIVNDFDLEEAIDEYNNQKSNRN